MKKNITTRGKNIKKLKDINDINVENKC